VDDLATGVRQDAGAIPAPAAADGGSGTEDRPGGLRAQLRAAAVDIINEARPAIIARLRQKLLTVAPAPQPRERSAADKKPLLVRFADRMVALRTIATTIILGWLAFMFYRELDARPIAIIEKIAVPQQLVDLGYSGSVVASRIGDAIRAFYLQTKYQGTDFQRSEGQPDIQVPGAGISMRAAASYVRAKLGYGADRRVDGEITILAPEACPDRKEPGKLAAAGRLQLTLRNDRGAFIPACEVIAPAGQIEELFAEAGRRAVLLTDPVEFVWHLYHHEWPGDFAQTREALAKTLPFATHPSSRRDRNDEALRLPLAEARVAADAGEYGKAEQVLRELEQQFPREQAPFERHAELLLILGRYEEAVESYGKAMQNAARFSEEYKTYAANFAAIAQVGRAEQVYQKAASRGYAPAAVYTDWGRFLEDQGESERAVEKFREAYAWAPRDVQRIAELSLALTDGGHADEALRFCAEGDAIAREAARDKEKRVAPVDPEARALLQFACGRALAALGKHEEAIQLYRQAIGGSPWVDNRARAFWGLSLMQLGRTEQAVEQCRTVVPWLTRDDLGPAYVCGRGSVWIGDDRSALTLLMQAAEAHPYDLAPWIDAGDALGRMGRYEEALRAWDRAIERAPGDIGTIFWRGWKTFVVGAFAKAAADFTRVLEARRPDDWGEKGWLERQRYAAVIRFIAETRLGRGDAQARLAAAAAALKVDCAASPRDWPAPVVCFLQSRQTSEDRDTLLRTARDDDPDRRNWKGREALFYLGQHYLLGQAAGDREEALRLFRRAAILLSVSIELDLVRAELRRLEADDARPGR
jgi:tetratricopeptide (TPR) repeat protein